ncbi:MAG: DCC1-like thiol-disulfide oxidoreductase family protein [Rickettsiales bacterium]|nr:DCC1-like thiol-disulfide oxidoreductase family protein [Pseudomonadota bacterium]MDA0967277.1 DCC1-like thiol-disulfide oxidoreductase family protein [Pseudomonadota bacterium]MDG4544062.1 DCC1-like thiol-disulfide oxidoreductase family protein [Rickettsiales bacterium]MDG4546244.1 DCC1-like thiol-disulfide oxidoreductase family protein [Rickettsiales bacterium]MDG4548386.1 DCC1-like thiol-disulfide oxidoreductase family protein [Rickettsiales bacterium]
MYIVYDGECPFCSRYVRLLRLKETGGVVKIIDARTLSNDSDIIKKIHEKGYTLDEGMALIIDDDVYHGDECIHKLALMSTSANWFNRFNRFVFKSRRISKVLYPVLRSGRNFALLLLGKKKIDM